MATRRQGYRVIRRGPSGAPTGARATKPASAADDRFRNPTWGPAATAATAPLPLPGFLHRTSFGCGPGRSLPKGAFRT